MQKQTQVGISLTSSMHVGQEYIDLTRGVAETLAREQFGIVYGGTSYGMMLELAESYIKAGGNNLVGVMAKDLIAVTKDYESYNGLSEQYLEDTMEMRKFRIAQLSDAFLVLPGGYGSFEELASFLGGNVNKLFSKPVAIYNYKGFYDTLINFLDEICEKEFSKIRVHDVALISENLDEIIQHLRTQNQTVIPDKFI